MKAKPVLIVIAGPNGSGKTTITEQLRAHVWMQGCTYINPDLLAQEKYGGWDSPQGILQAAQEAESIRKECFANRANMAFETVFSAPDKIRFLRAAMRVGYFVRLFFVCTDSPEINAGRVLGRRLEGGHDVPLDKIKSRFAKSIAQCAAVIQWVDRAYLYDNSVNDAPPALLFRTDSGRLVRQYRDLRPWAEPIFQRIKHSA